MTKGHSKGMHDVNDRQKGGEGHLKKKQREKATPEGKRNPGTKENDANKGKNSI